VLRCKACKKRGARRMRLYVERPGLQRNAADGRFLAAANILFHIQDDSKAARRKTFEFNNFAPMRY